MHVERYVAIGDSQTEGLNDGDEATGFRGWADRLADHLAAVNPKLQYANLAIRGRKAEQIRAEQLDVALALEPDFATVVAGMNNVLRPKVDIDAVVADVEAMFAALTAAGTRVATVEFPDIGRVIPLVRPLVPRVVELNAKIAEAADRHGVVVLKMYEHDASTHPDLWSADRLHLSTVGHQCVADGMAHALGLPGSSTAYRDPRPPVARTNPLVRGVHEAQWTVRFLSPWIMRRIRGVSSGDGRSAKRPELLPVIG